MGQREAVAGGFGLLASPCVLASRCVAPYTIVVAEPATIGEDACECAHDEALIVELTDSSGIREPIDLLKISDWSVHKT